VQRQTKQVVYVLYGGVKPRLVRLVQICECPEAGLTSGHFCNALPWAHDPRILTTGLSSFGTATIGDKREYTTKARRLASV
jgi:hypothetical protein